MRVQTINGEEFTLTKTRIQQDVGDSYRWVTFKDLRENMPRPGSRSKGYPKILHYPEGVTQTTWLNLIRGLKLSIGCKRFNAENTRLIFRAAGIRIGRARSAAKKSKRRKRA